MPLETLDDLHPLPSSPEAALRHQRDLTELITTHVAEGLCLMDAEGRLTYMNPAAERILGWSLAELKGLVLHDAVHHVHPDGTPFPASECPLRQTLVSGVVIRDREDVWVHRSGELIPVFCSCTPLRRDGAIIGAVLSLHDITQRKRAESRQRLLAESASLLGSSLDYERTLREVARLCTPSLADYCLVHCRTPEGRIQMVASAHRDPGKEPLLARMAELHPSDPGEGGGLVADVLRSGEPDLIPSIPDALLRRYGREPELREIVRALGPRSVMVVPLTARGQTLGTLSFFRAESDREHEPEDLALAMEVASRAALAIDNARLYAEAREANRAKANFLAVMSHELRTPLNAIMAFAELLQMGIPEPVPTTALTYVGRIDHAARHLLELIEEILTFSRVEAGREEVRFADTDLGEVAREAVAFVQPLAGKKALSIGLVMADAPVRAWTDGGKVRQVLVNLLFNAVKFTPAGGIRLEVERGGGDALLHVRDTGIGIPEPMLGKIFEPFWQAQDPVTREVGGTGLGLSISRRIAQLLGGSLCVQSEVGVGTTFTLQLPLDGGAAAGKGA